MVDAGRFIDKRRPSALLDGEPSTLLRYPCDSLLTRHARPETTLRRIALFAHFDSQNSVRKFIFYHIEQLRRVCDSISFVSNSPIDRVNTSKLESLGCQVLVRENTGYDFSAWQLGFDSITPTDWDELVLTNSSVFGPVFPLEPAFERMRSEDVEFWGMTENVAVSSHVQSYFMVFRRKVLESRAFATFWSSILPYLDKYQTIRSYELGLTTFLAEQGFRHTTFFPRDAARGFWSRRLLRDPTLSCPLKLLQAKVPYIKTALLRDNPKHVSLAPVYRAIEQSDYDRSLIEFDRPHGVFHVKKAT